MTEQRWFVGVDWGTEEHAVCIVDADGTLVGERVFKHTGSALAEMCSWLLKAAGDDPSALDVAIEVPHGAVVETLLERGIRVHALNPKQLDRFRDRFTVAGAKDDRRDAYVLAASLRTDMKCFRPLRLYEALVIELREWSRIAQELQEDRVRFGNRLQQQLLRYYPQMLELADDVANDTFLALWELLPTPQHAIHVRERDVAKLLKAQRIRRFDAKHVLTTLRQKPLSVAAGTTEAARAHIASLAARLRLVNRQLKDTHRKLDAIVDALGTKEDSEPGQRCEQRDVDILRSLPGVGRIVLATLLTEASQPLAERDYHALRLLCGAAPVTRNSGKRQGKRSIVVMRYACHMRLRNAVYHWARVASQVDPKSRTAYAELRARGHSHGRTLRTIADRLLRMAVAMLRSRTLFDPTLRLAV